ncbi:hypothetical protein POVWA2_036830 [Plasmodium ovale wallikeri]|uniref:Uncharacterized protein n=1 Tax=Plasmodium ovale wallikeri TaxID=864142 RepID=A0A1A8Z574_PLAOA|nr:hypothetical protein POVWA1_037860 [Plasmodium ovale wallikeri]SBT39007.1 hypothetical protein POVWA2_036830 [Plasmodium ovale wallikeri]
MTVHHQYSKSGNYGEEKPTCEETHQGILLHCVAVKRGSGKEGERQIWGAANMGSGKYGEWQIWGAANMGSGKEGELQTGLNSSICDGVALMDHLLCISPFR